MNKKIALLLCGLCGPAMAVESTHSASAWEDKLFAKGDALCNLCIKFGMEERTQSWTICTTIRQEFLNSNNASLPNKSLKDAKTIVNGMLNTAQQKLRENPDLYEQIVDDPLYSVIQDDLAPQNCKAAGDCALDSFLVDFLGVKEEEYGTFKQGIDNAQLLLSQGYLKSFRKKSEELSTKLDGYLDQNIEKTKIFKISESSNPDDIAREIDLLQKENKGILGLKEDSFLLVLSFVKEGLCPNTFATLENLQGGIEHIKKIEGQIDAIKKQDESERASTNLLEEFKNLYEHFHQYQPVSTKYNVIEKTQKWLHMKKPEISNLATQCIETMGVLSTKYQEMQKRECIEQKSMSRAQPQDMLQGNQKDPSLSQGQQRKLYNKRLEVRQHIGKLNLVIDIIDKLD